MIKKSNRASVHESVIGDNYSVQGISVVGALVTLPTGAEIAGNGCILSDSDVLVLGPGPSGAYTTAHKDSILGVRINTRCFSGNLKAFEERLVKDGSVTPEQRATAHEFIEQIKIHFGL